MIIPLHDTLRQQVATKFALTTSLAAAQTVPNALPGQGGETTAGRGHAGGGAGEGDEQAGHGDWARWRWWARRRRVFNPTRPPPPARQVPAAETGVAAQVMGAVTGPVVTAAAAPDPTTI